MCFFCVWAGDIFELGLQGEVFQDQRGKLSYSEAIRSIASRNPYITTVLPFDTNKRMVNNYSYRPDKEVQDALGQVIQNRSTLQFENATKRTTIR